MIQRQKRKRFEGLIHFRDSLRQIAVCLQASLAKGFATQAQSEFVLRLDQQQTGVYHVLLSSNRDVGVVKSDDQVKNHHILTRIFQTSDCFDPKLHQAKFSRPAKVTTWIDPVDNLASHELYQVLVHICNHKQTLDLKKREKWGAFVTQHQYKSRQEASDWIEAWRACFRVNHQRSKQLMQSIQEFETLFDTIEVLQLSSDGTNFNITAEGQFCSSNLQNPAALALQCQSIRGHTIIINASDRHQISIVSPIRITQDNGPSSLRALVLVQDLQAHKSPQNSQQAS